MTLCGKYVIIVIVTFIGTVRSQECSLEAADFSLRNRTHQYKQVLADGASDEMVEQLCLTQIRPDENAVKFEDALILCTTAEADILQNGWFGLNSNITALCQQDCPDLLRLPECKNMTYLGEIEFSKYEKFCQTFQKSYECAVTSTNDCKFGMQLYAKILEPKVMQYWTYICKSGCSNIDETVADITKCLEPFKSIKKSETCIAHYTFKECMAQAQNICAEVLKLVRFIYRKYDLVDKYCTTTTTVTTTSLPETTTLPETTMAITETPEPTEVATETSTSVKTTTIMTSVSFTETPEITEVATEKTTTSVKSRTTMTSFSTEVPDVVMSTEPTVTGSSVPIQIEDCLSAKDLEVIEATEINFDSIVVFLKLEACLHNKTADTQKIEVIRASFPASVQQFHAKIRAEAWLVAQQNLKDGINCQQKQEELTDGCSGHEYGLIPCNSGTVFKSDFIKMVTGAIFTVFLYMAAW